MNAPGPALAGMALSLIAAMLAAPLAGPAAGSLAVIAVMLGVRVGRTTAVATALVACAATMGALWLEPTQGATAVAVSLALLGTAILAPHPELAPPVPTRTPPPVPRVAPSAKADLHPILDALPDWVVEVDDDFCVRAANHPPGGVFPAIATSDLGRPVVDFFDGNLRKIVTDNLNRSKTLGRHTAFEYYLRAHDKLYFAEMRIVPHGDSLWMVSRDITGKRGREEALRESKERFALAAQGANDGLWDWNLVTGEVYYSHTFKSLLGFEGTDFGSDLEAWLSRVHPDDARRVRADLDAHLEGHAPRYESEHRIQDSDGDWLWVLSRGMAVRDSQGKAKRIAGSMTDLTHRRVVAATAEKSRLLEHATRAVGIGIAMRTRKHTLVEPSPMLVEMVTAWESVDAWWQALQPELDLPPSIPCESCSAKQIVGSTRVSVVDPHGGDRVFELTFTGHGHEVQHDQLVNVVLIEDVTVSALAEARLHKLNAELVSARDQALAASRAKSAFLANMSHELRTPLNAILGYSEMLLEDAEEGDNGVEDLRRIHGAGAHLLGLIAGILDLSKVEAGIMQVDLSEVAVDALIEEVRITAEPLARGNAFLVDGGELGTMRTDVVKLRQILLNLLNNAFKFTDHGSVTLEARADLTHVTFRIRDTGIGIAEELRERLFEEFVQGDLSSTKAFQGAGLGLALVKRFAALLGGSVEVDSIPGDGSTFTVVLPREPDMDPETETLEIDVSALDSLM